jgi:hypothetical protein
MKPMSRYDHKPRNVEFDGDRFVASTRRRSSGSDRRDRQSGAAEEAGDVEFKVQKEEGFDRSEVKVQSDTVRMEMWQVIALGCFLGLLFGILYRGGIGGLYLGLFPKGMCDMKTSRCDVYILSCFVCCR